MERSPRWKLVFLDGRYALYARVDGPSAGLARRFGYRVIGARRAVDVDLLAGHDACGAGLSPGPSGGEPRSGAERSAQDVTARDVAARAAFTRDLVQLRQQGALLARGHEACLGALTTTTSTPEKIMVPLEVVLAVVARLPPCATLVACLGAGLRRAGQERMGHRMLLEARMMFPDDPVIRRLNRPAERACPLGACPRAPQGGSPARVRSGAGKM